MRLNVKGWRKTSPNLKLKNEKLSGVASTSSGCEATMFLVRNLRLWSPPTPSLRIS